MRNFSIKFRIPRHVLIQVVFNLALSYLSLSSITGYLSGYFNGGAWFLIWGIATLSAIFLTCWLFFVGVRFAFSQEGRSYGTLACASLFVCVWVVSWSARNVDSAFARGFDKWLSRNYMAEGIRHWGLARAATSSSAKPNQHELMLPWESMGSQVPASDWSPEVMAIAPTEVWISTTDRWVVFLWFGSLSAPQRVVLMSLNSNEENLAPQMQWVGYKWHIHPHGFYVGIYNGH
jgi:hypothetical protein